MKNLLKIQMKELFISILSGIFIIIGITLGMGLLISYVEKLNGTPFALNYALIAASKPLASILVIIMVVIVIEFTVTIKLHLLSGYTRKSIFGTNILIILIGTVIASLVIAIIVAMGIKLQKTGIIFTGFNWNIVPNEFIENFIQLICLMLTISFVAISFKKNIVLGFIILVYGILTLNLVGVGDNFSMLKFLLEGKNQMLIDYVLYGVFSAISFVGYREVMKRF